MINGKELLHRLGIENQPIVNKGSGSSFDLESILDRIILVNEPKDFDSAARVLIKYLCDNHHPHVSVIVTPTSAELVQGIQCTGSITDYIKD